MWEIHNGPIPEGRTCVLHHCDNPLCINVDHLWLGDDADNCADRDAKGRGRIPFWMMKLEPDQVEEIRWLLNKGWGPTAIAERYDVSLTPIQQIRDGLSWQYITEMRRPKWLDIPGIRRL
jgi:hypothetical protein